MSSMFLKKKEEKPIETKKDDKKDDKKLDKKDDTIVDAPVNNIGKRNNKVTGINNVPPKQRATSTEYSMLNTKLDKILAHMYMNSYYLVILDNLKKKYNIDNYSDTYILKRKTCMINNRKDWNLMRFIIRNKNTLETLEKMKTY